MVFKKNFLIAGLVMVSLSPLAANADDIFHFKYQISDGITGRVLGVPKPLDELDPAQKSAIWGEIQNNACLKQAIATVKSKLEVEVQPSLVLAKSAYEADTDAKTPGCGKSANSYEVLVVINENIIDRNPKLANNQPNPNLGKTNTYNVVFSAREVTSAGKVVAALPISNLKIAKNEPSIIGYGGLSTDTSCPALDVRLTNTVNSPALQAATAGKLKGLLASGCAVSTVNPEEENILGEKTAAAAKDSTAGTPAEDIAPNQRFGIAGRPQ
jgi:hypothetical protein